MLPSSMFLEGGILFWPPSQAACVVLVVWYRHCGATDKRGSAGNILDLILVPCPHSPTVSLWPQIWVSLLLSQLAVSLSPGCWISLPYWRGTHNSNIKNQIKQDSAKGLLWSKRKRKPHLESLGRPLRDGFLSLSHWVSTPYWELGVTKDSDVASVIEVLSASWERQAHKKEYQGV